MFWEKLSDEAFQYMFQIESVIDIDLQQNEFNRLVGWSEKMACRMFVHRISKVLYGFELSKTKLNKNTKFKNSCSIYSFMNKAVIRKNKNYV